jgi:hypothetical protein
VHFARQRLARRALATLLGVAALALPLAGTAASAHRARPVSTRIVVSEEYPALHGVLHSRSRFCSARRRLLVYRARRGHDKLVGRGWSHRSGAWKVPLGKKLGRGHYYVIAPMRASAAIRCLRAHSKSVPVVEGSG